MTDREFSKFCQEHDLQVIDTDIYKNAPYEEIVRIKEIESNEWIFLECIKSNDLSNTFFQEERFYPIQILNIEGIE